MLNRYIFLLFKTVRLINQERDQKIPYACTVEWNITIENQLSERTIIHELNVEPNKAKQVLLELLDEGFIKKCDDRYQIDILYL